MIPFAAARLISPCDAFGSPLISTVPDVWPSRSRILSGRSMGSAASRLPAFTFVSVAFTATLFAPVFGTLTVNRALPPSLCCSLPLRKLTSIGETKISVATLPSSRPCIEIESSDALPSTVGSEKLPVSEPSNVRFPATATCIESIWCSSSGDMPSTRTRRSISDASADRRASVRFEFWSFRSKRPLAVRVLLSDLRLATSTLKRPLFALNFTCPFTGISPLSAVPALALISAFSVPVVFRKSVPGNVRSTWPVVWPSIGVIPPPDRAISFAMSRSVKSPVSVDWLRLFSAITALPFN